MEQESRFQSLSDDRILLDNLTGDDRSLHLHLR